VTINNPLRTVVVPVSRILEVDTSRSYTVVVTAERSYRCAGLENSLSMLVRQKADSSTARFSDEVRTADVASDVVGSYRRRPTTVEIVVASSWLALAVVSFIVR
jgi:hypothetical protein